MQPRVRRRVAAFLRITIRHARSQHEWMRFLPERYKQWGGLQNNGCGDCIRATCARNLISACGKRDNCLYENTGTAGQSKCLSRPDTAASTLSSLATTLPPDPRFDIESSQPRALAYTAQAKGAIGYASTRLVSYTKMGRSFVLNIIAVHCAVGRVKMQADKSNGEWAIVDRNEDLCQTALHQEEQEFEEDG
ncbi:hypothetical protein RhiJN_27597 [Ceratobasidium sp. AG-Ba]|nr:hypothetical protein RhiJN_27597 [Ceratobasidium sp. AG-Ba]